MKWISMSCVFTAILAGHFLYKTQHGSTSEGSGPWAAYTFDQPEESRLDRYIEPGEYWVGFSYGLAGAFATFCLIRAVQMRRRSLAASAGGLAISGLLGVTFCFFAGCCGSPMLPVYLGLLGPNFLSVTRPLTFGITVVSIGVACAMMLRKDRSVPCCGSSPRVDNVNHRLHENLGADPGQV